MSWQEADPPPAPTPEVTGSDWPETAYLLSGWVQQNGAKIDAAVLRYLAAFTGDLDRVARLQTELAALLSPGRPPAELDVLVAKHARRWVILPGRQVLEKISTAVAQAQRA